MPIKKIAKSAVFDALVSELKEREALSEAARDATNTLNRHNTKTGKTFVAFYSAEKLPPRTQVVIDGVAYMYGTAESRVIDAKKWYELWQAGEITEDQYFDCLTVGKKDASLVIGEDQVEMLSIDKLGTAADIRRDASNAGTIAGVQVITPAPTNPVKPLVKPAVQVTAPKRFVKIGRS